MPAISIISIEDSLPDQIVLEKLLRQGREVDLTLVHTASVDAAKEILLERVPDIVVLDYHLWDGTALDVLHTLDERGTLERVPVLILTAEGNEPNALEALRLGAQHYLLKDRLTAQTLWTAIDLSRERLANAQALRKNHEELEARVAQRTVALQRSIDDLNGFTYSISHDIRAPLRAIDASCRILIEDLGPKLEPDDRASLERQSKAARKLGSLIDDLLRYAKLGRQPMDHSPFDLSALACDVAERLNQTGWIGEGVDYRIEPEMRADGDAAQIEIVLNILMENAAKYRRPGRSPVVRVGSETSDLGQAFSVADDGIGFDMAYVDKLFKPFGRLHRDDEFAGTGIGLANARRIVERHGGTIWAEGVLGEGSTFRFTFGADEPTSN